MACCSKPADAATQRSRAIEQEVLTPLPDDIKILLLGPGESGKSTIFKQMRILQKTALPHQEVMRFKSAIHSNIVQSVQAMLTAANALAIAVGETERMVERMGRVMSVDCNQDIVWTSQLREDVKVLWASEGVKEVYKFRDVEYQLNETAAYFLDDMDRITADSYVPTDADILRMRVRSSGIEEAQFKFKDISFRMLDVGGQRTERRKWIHCFEGVTAVLFCAGLSEYDQTLREDDKTNRMREAISLFSDICNSQWFKNTAMVLFLNKTDVFREKLGRSSLKRYFPDYAGTNDYEPASEFIKDMFLRTNKNPKEHEVYVHFTCAVNTDNISLVFDSVKDILLKQAFKTRLAM